MPAAPSTAGWKHVRAWHVAAASVAAALGLAASFAWQRRAAPPSAPAVRALALVPPGPVFALSLDVAELSRSALGRRLLAEGLGGLGSGGCARRLLGLVDELAVAVPAEANEGAPGTATLAVIATGRFSGAEVVSCGEERLRARHQTPVRTPIGSFVAVRDPSHGGELASRDGLLLLSAGSYLRQLIDAADGRRAEGTPEERQRDALHAELRRTFGRGAPLIATLALPPVWLARALADTGARLSPLALVTSAALRAELGDGVALAGLVGCTSASGCDRVAAFVRHLARDLGPEAPPEAVALLGRVKTERHELRIDWSLRLSEDEAKRLFASAR